MSGSFLVFFGFRYPTVWFCELIWEYKVAIGNTHKDDKKIQYFISGISIATLCTQELANVECSTHT